MSFHSGPNVWQNIFMADKSSSKNNCFCAFCKSSRRIYRKKNISGVNVLGSVLASIVTMFVFWQGFDPRAIVIFVVFIAISEAFVKIRWRLSLVCGVCGFDPVLYLKDHSAAAKKVKLRLDERKEDPKYLFTKPLNLPAISEERAKALETKSKGRLVSRSI